MRLAHVIITFWKQIYIYNFSKRYRQNFLVLYKVDLIENRPLDYSLNYMA